MTTLSPSRNFDDWSRLESAAEASRLLREVRVNTRNGLGWGFILIVLSATPAAGQSFSWGLKGGITFATLQIVATDSSWILSTIFGLTAGVFITRDFGAASGCRSRG